MNRRKGSRTKHALKEFATRLEARIAAWREMKATGDFQGYIFHKPGSQNRKK
ncbi:MAG: hypothetical protein ACREOB_05675 [Thermodesulfobacteriota bacterium]